MSKLTPLIPEVETNVIKVRTVTHNNAVKLSEYLPVRLRDFFLAMHPLAQAYLYEQSTSPEEFFILVDMEEQRFNKIGKRYSFSKGGWIHDENFVQEHAIVWKDIVPAGPEDVLLITEDKKL